MYYRKRNYVKEMNFKNKNKYIHKLRKHYNLIELDT
jgi:hypothetical protein